jgi:deoxyribonuclease-4
MQIFCGNPRAWGARAVPVDEIEAFRAERTPAALRPVVVHAAYLVNLASPDDELFRKSIRLLKDELRLSEALGAEYLVTHPGSPRHRGAEYAVKRVVEALGEVAASGLGAKTAVLMENTAGAGEGFGGGLRHIGEIIDCAGRLGLKAGLCLDTCHAHAAGYAIRTREDVSRLLVALKRDVGLDRLKLIHLNDSKAGAGSGLDRHEHIGRGTIGLEGFRRLFAGGELSGVPVILETPKESEADDRRNLRVARSFIQVGQAGRVGRGRS